MTYFNKPLRNDNIFVKTEIVNANFVTPFPTRRGLERVILSENQIVNFVSKNYAHLPNEDFFYKVEEMLILSDIKYKTRSINRENRSFCVEYILEDERYQIDVKNSNDIIKPMLRFTNSYDGSCKTSGSIGFYREVCQNGLHIAKIKAGFSVRHTGDIKSVVLPKIGNVILEFMNNEFFEIRRKYEALADFKMLDAKEVVKQIADQTKLFKFECSEENPEPSKKARFVLDTIEKESNFLNEDPNLWLVYNAFNELIHTQMKKSFTEQENFDKAVLNNVLELVN